MIHGTYSTYKNHRCRCDDCRAANAADARERRARNASPEPTVAMQLFPFVAGDWVGRAACAGYPTALFFPECNKGRSARRHPDVLRAVSICASCPVRQQCADEAKRTGVEYGIWGGVYYNHGRAVSCAD